MKEKTCCFTGHRTKDLPKNTKALESELYRCIEDMIHRGVTNFIAGGAVGFDTMAALAVIDLRKKYSDMKLSLYLPCKDQQAGWSTFDQKTYHAICLQADEVIYISKRYFHGCMHKRNRAMIDSSDFCIAFLNKEEGGTFYTVRYAKSKGIKVVNLADCF